MSDALSGPGDAADAGTRRLSELRVIDLRAELKRRNLDTGGNKSALLERLRKAVQDEGREPQEAGVFGEATSKRPAKRGARGLKLEEEGGEDNGVEEDSRDRQEDQGVSVPSLPQGMDAVDLSVLDRPAERGSVPAHCSVCPFCRKEYVAAQLGRCPAQLPGLAVQEDGVRHEEPSVLDLSVAPAGDGGPSQPENEKILDILGETCKSEPGTEEGFEAEQPCAGALGGAGPDGKAAEEEDLFASASGGRLEEEEEEQEEEQEMEEQEEGDLALACSESPRVPSCQWREADTPLAVVKREPAEQPGEGEGEGEGAGSDREPVGLEEPAGQSSEASEAAGQEPAAPTPAATSAAPPASVASPGPRAREEDAKKFALDACSDTPATPRESSASGGADQRMSSLKEERDVKPVVKDEKGCVSSSSGRNLWVSGLSSSTRAADLKSLFSKHGKVVGAKVVTNARSPGARCYGFVTMATSDEVTKCISHLHRTELHGRMISVEKAKNEPSGKRPPDRKDGGVKEEKVEAADRPHLLEIKPDKAEIKKEKEEEEKWPADIKEEKDEDEPKLGAGSCPRTSKSGSRGPERTVVMDKAKGEPVVSVKTTSRSKERSSRSADRGESRERRDILSFDKIKEQRERERQRQREREIRETERRREREQRLDVFLERREKARLQRERWQLECQRQRLERERMRVERERRREQERIAREREELRRQQEQLRAEQERRALRRACDLDARRDDAYWPEAKRAALEDRYRPDFPRPDPRFHDFDHRERTQYQDHVLDRRDGARLPGAQCDGQYYLDDHHSHGGPPERYVHGVLPEHNIHGVPPERHSRDTREDWYISEKRTSDGRGPPPPPSPRGSRDWAEHSPQLEEQHVQLWQDAMDAGATGREQVRWQGAERGLPGPSGPGPGPGHVAPWGGMAGRGGHPQGHVVPTSGLEGSGVAVQDRGRAPPSHPHLYPHFTRRY